MVVVTGHPNSCPKQNSSVPFIHCAGFSVCPDSLNLQHFGEKMYYLFFTFFWSFSFLITSYFFFISPSESSHIQMFSFLHGVSNCLNLFIVHHFIPLSVRIPQLFLSFLYLFSASSYALVSFIGDFCSCFMDAVPLCLSEDMS